MRFDLSSIIDPELWSLADESRAFYARRQFGRGARNLDELRAFRLQAPAHAVCEPQPVLEQVSAEGRTVPVRIHVPAGNAPSGVILEIHTGGFFMGSAAGSDLRNRRLVETLGVAVVSVDYRLAPENPWPAAPDDCEIAAFWLAEHAQARFGTTNVAVTGFSAGATLTMATLLRFRDRGLKSLQVDLRVYPASPHAFSGHATSMARVALDDIDQWLRDRLGVLH